MVRYLPKSTRRALFCLVSACLIQPLAASQDSIPTFGTTVVDSSDFRGDVYAIPPGTDSLPKFKNLHAIGSIYTSTLNVPGRNFTEGFPGVTGRTEWFAIDYTGKFWVTSRRTFRFALESDDGSRLLIDGHTLIDNDGSHPSSGCTGRAELAEGVHQIRVSYFQGPGYAVALMLGVADEQGAWHIFDTRNFRPPADFDSTSRPRPTIRKIKRGNCWAR